MPPFDGRLSEPQRSQTFELPRTLLPGPRTSDLRSRRHKVGRLRRMRFFTGLLARRRSAIRLWLWPDPVRKTVALHTSMI